MADQLSKQNTNLAEKSMDRSRSREISGRRRCQSEASLDKDESSTSNKPADGRRRKRTRSMTTKDTDGTLPSLSNKKHKLSRNKASCKTGHNKEEGKCSDQPSSHEDQNAVSVSTTKIIPVFGKKKGASVEPSTENSTAGSDKTSNQRKEEMDEEANSKGEENLAIHSDIVELLPQSCEGENVGDIKNIGFAGMKQAVSDGKGLDGEENKDEGDQKVKESLGDGKPSEEDAVKHTPKQLQSRLGEGDQNAVDEINLEGQTSIVTNEEVKVPSNMNPDDICVSKTSPPRLMIEKDSSPIEVSMAVHAKSSPLKNGSPPDEPMINSITPQHVDCVESTTSDDAHEVQVTKTTLAACNVDGRTTPEISHIAEHDALDSRGCKVDLEGAGVGKKSTAAKTCTLAVYDGVETVHGRNKELSCAETGSDQTSKVTAEIMLDTFSSSEDMNIQRNDSAPVCIPRDSATYTQENKEVILHESVEQLEDMSKKIKVEAAQVCGTVHSSNASFKEARDHGEDPRQGRSSPEQEEAMGFSDETKDDTIKTLSSTGRGSKTQVPGLNYTSEKMLAGASPDDKDNDDQDGISTLKTVLTFEAERVNRPRCSGTIIQEGGVDVGDDLPQFCLQDSEGQLCSSDGDGLVIDMMDFTDSQMIELDLQCNMPTKPRAVSSSPLSSRDHSDLKSAVQCEDKAVQTLSPQVVCQDGNDIVQRMIQDIQSLNSTIVEIKRQIEGVRRQSRQDGGQRQLPQKRPWSAGKASWKRPFLKK